MSRPVSAGSSARPTRRRARRRSARFENSPRRRRRRRRARSPRSPTPPTPRRTSSRTPRTCRRTAARGRCVCSARSPCERPKRKRMKRRTSLVKVKVSREVTFFYQLASSSGTWRLWRRRRLATPARTSPARRRLRWALWRARFPGARTATCFTPRCARRPRAAAGATGAGTTSRARRRCTSARRRRFSNASPRLTSTPKRAPSAKPARPRWRRTSSGG